MKCLHLQGTILLILFGYTVNSQVNVPLNQHPTIKPTLFNQLPEKLICPVAVLQNIFDSNSNTRLDVKLANHFNVEGIVLERTTVTPQQLSINIRCTNFKNALLNISRVTHQDGSVTFTGRMISPAYGDVLLLCEEKGEYSFVKQKQLLSMVE
jgi:hypothetical protein